MLPSSGLFFEIKRCKCNDCSEHDSRHECITRRCSCCDLEDMFAVITRLEPGAEIICEKGFLENKSIA